MAENWKILNFNLTHSSFNEDKETNWEKNFYFVQAADCQLGLLERYVLKLENPGWEKEKILTKLAIDKINGLQPRPRFFVICGDLCDAYPEKDPETRAKQEKDLKQILKQLNPEIPLVCVCGNHDVGDQPTSNSIELYKNSFGDDYYSFWCGGLLFLVINSQLWMNDSLTPDYKDSHDAWIDGQLKIAKQNKSRVIIFQHIPWFLQSAAEPELYYFTLPTNLRKYWLPKFKKAGVAAIFCGHYHRNAEGEYEGMPVITSSAIGAQLGNDQSGMRIVKVYANTISHKYYSFEDFPSHIDNI